MRLASISIDLDELSHYHAIHGLSAAPSDKRPVYERALPRAAEWAASFGLPLTLFTIGSDLEHEPNAAFVRELFGRGHEIANHSYSHRYDLTLRDRAELEYEVRAGIAAVTRATGEPPRGFRAPGYLMSDDLMDVLEGAGVGYDSSVFPCPAYFAAKAAKLLALRVRGRPSRSVQGSAQVLRAPTRPYRAGRPYFRPGGGLCELPVQVTPGMRLPYIGTSLVLAGPDGARLLTRMLLLEPFVNLELHGIDFLGADDELESLARDQPDARLPLSRKLASIGAAVELLRRHGFSFVRLDEAARAVA